MSRGIGFGIGAGAVSVLAAVLAASPVVRGGVEASAPEKAEGESARKKADRRVHILMRGGSYLGVRLEDVDKDDVARLKLPEEKGALVKRVEDDSPAAKAGLKAGDVIVRYHGEAVLSAAQLARLVRETPPGRTVTLEVARDGAVQNLSATIGGDDRGAWSLGDWGDFDVRIPETVPPVPPVPPLPPRAFERWGKRALLEDLVWPGAGPRRLGIEYTEIHGQLAKYFKLTEDEGVLVTSVDPDGPAAKAGLKAGDVILKIGARSIQDGDDLRRAVRKAEPGRETSLTVLRDGRSLELKLTPAGEGKEPEGTEL